MTIHLTPNVAQRIGAQLAKRGKGLGLRLGLTRTGCSGYAYKLDYADEVLPGEQVFEEHGARLVVSSADLDILDGITVDFQRQGLNEAFRFDNPKVKGQCGCGESFTI